MIIELYQVGIITKFPFWYYANLRDLINFYSLLNHQNTYGFLMIPGGLEVN